VKNGFQQVAFCGNGLSGRSERRISFRDNHQSFVAFSPDTFIFNLNTANTPVMRGIEGIGQTQNCRELKGCLLLVREEIAQSLVLPGGQGSAVKAGDGGGPLQICRLPA